jgi:chitin disaccharide deacetylase
MTKRIWLCADDYGISPSVDAAIRDLVVRGRINATSVMVLAPSLHRMEANALAALNKVERHVAIGLHVTLTAPYRPLSEGFKPTRDGAFLPLAPLLMRASLRSLDTQAFAAEVASQVRAFKNLFDRPPDFIDGHQHVHLFPQIRDAVLEVAKREAPSAWVRQCGRPSALAYHPGDRKGLLLDILSRGFRQRAAALGVRTNPAFVGTYAFTDAADFAATFPRFLEPLPDGGVVMCHPGFVDAELQRLDPLTTLREQEYAFFVDEAFPALLARHGVALA